MLRHLNWVQSFIFYLKENAACLHYKYQTVKAIQEAFPYLLQK
jgi:hypothetical protein